MGTTICCCQSRDKVQFDEMELNEIPGITPTDDMPNKPQPQFTHHMTRSSNSGTLEGMHMISEMALCDEHTDELCPTTLRVISILSLYHQFIVDYDPMSINNENIMDLIDQSLNEYILPNLRDDVHHIQSYHESNAKYMMLLYMKLIEFNNELANPIRDLSAISRAITEDQEHRSYFGHKMLDEIAMIQLLNQIHDDFTNPFGDEQDTVSSDPKTVDSMNARSSTITHDTANLLDHNQHATNQGLEMIDESDSSEMDLRAGTAHTVNHNANHRNIDLDDDLRDHSDGNSDRDSNDDSDDDSDDDLDDLGDDVVNTMHEDIDQRGQHIGTAYDKTKGANLRKRGKKKKKQKKTKKRGYHQGVSSNPLDIDDDLEDDQRDHIDVQYGKQQKESRKIGRLKLKKPKKKTKIGTANGGKGKVKIVGDTSWMKQKKREEKTGPTQSIMQLRGTALVSKLSEELHTLAAEDEFREELEEVNMGQIEVEGLNVDDFENTKMITKMKKQRSAHKLLEENGDDSDTGLFDEKYEVDAV